MEGRGGATQYYVAVSNNDVKLTTLVDLLLALLAPGPLGLMVSCSSRDTLDTVVGGLRSSLPSAEVHVLHSDLSAEEVDNTLEVYARKVSRLQEPQELNEEAEVEEQDMSAPQRDYMQEAAYGRSPVHQDAGDAQRTGKEELPSEPKGKEQKPTAQVLVATDICFKHLEAHQIPSELPLLVNYDLPMRKELYLRQLQLFGGKGASGRGADHVDHEQRIIVFFLVAGQIADFRAFESLVPGPSKIDVMPVHVSDIFSQTGSSRRRVL